MLNTQCKLKSENIEQVVWLPAHPKLRAGVHVTLKDTEDPTRVWQVVETYSSCEKSDLKTTFTNNIDSTKVKKIIREI